jgi:hypothetical protein
MNPKRISSGQSAFGSAVVVADATVVSVADATVVSVAADVVVSSDPVDAHAARIIENAISSVTRLRRLSN